MKKNLLLLLMLAVTFQLAAQGTGTKTIDGQTVRTMITDAGDTILVAELEDVSVTSMRKFKSSKERRHYLRMKYHANVVYPYAVESIRLFRELEATTSDLKKRHRKKHIKRLQNELEEQFKEPLKKLTRTQGHILIKMIERELDMPMYDLVKNLRGGLTATYWNTFSRMYDIDLKQGYNPEDDPILETIISSMNISHKVAKN